MRTVMSDSDGDSGSASAGRAWVFGDNVDTDALAPGQYIKKPIEELASHCLESLEPGFASKVAVGDVVVGGRNFGMGSSREQAAQALCLLGVTGVVARSFGGIFFRNAINLGLPVFTPVSTNAEADNSTIAVADGDKVELDVEGARLINHTSGEQLQLTPLPEFLLEMIRAGGLVKVLEKRFAR